MDIFFEFLFTVSFSFIGSFILDKLLSFSSIIDQHLEILSGSYVEVTTESAEHVFECEKGIGFVSEAVKNDAFGESVEEIDTHEEFLDGSERSSEVKEGTFEGEENFVGETTKVGLAKEDEEEIGGLECEKEDEKDCLMKGLYDDDDDDWEIIERTELEKDFGKAVCLLECKRNADKDFKLGNDLKIQLYGLHKIATEGPCYEPQPMPFKLSARAKWDAWKRLGSMSQEAAMELYIILVSNSISGFVQDDVCGDGKQDSADTKANTKLPVDVETMSVNQAIDVDYNSTSNELTAPIQSSDGINSDFLGVWPSLHYSGISVNVAVIQVPLTLTSVHKSQTRSRIVLFCCQFDLRQPAMITSQSQLQAAKMIRSFCLVIHIYINTHKYMLQLSAFVQFSALRFLVDFGIVNSFSSILVRLVL
ncbi:hypothetical protein V6N13_052639 [Hibiscus sabdariffa]